jgi:hypothetical protein
VLFWCMTSGMLVDIPVGVGVADTAFLCPTHKRRQMIAMLTIEPKSRIVTVDCSSKYLPSSRVLSCETTAHSTQVKTPRLSMVAHSNCTIFATSAGTEVKTWEVSHGEHYKKSRYYACRVPAHFFAQILLHSSHVEPRKP